MTDMINVPVSSHKYEIFNIDTLPKTVLCTSVKNQYDETRLTIKSTYRPKYITHFQTINEELQPFYYYGINIKLKPVYSSMLKSICSQKLFEDNMPYTDKLNKYRKLLAEYDLTCDTCYAYFCDGVWPLDLKHLQTISVTDHADIISSGFEKLITRSIKRNPIYSRVLNFNILTLVKSNGYDN